jgi:anaerobic magnesium-protoporphyrin IX monomethyl ester cyclase
MKVLVVNPLPAGIMRISLPMSVGYIGAALKKAGHEVKIFDHILKPDASLGWELASYGPEVVAITGYSSQYPNMKRAAKIAKDFGATVIAGGLHCSAYPEYVMNDCRSIDFLIKGEGEIALPEFLYSHSVGTPGVYSRNGIVKGTPAEPIKDLDSLAFPWDVLNPKNYITYRPAGVVTRHLAVASILTSRGCPYGCTFCCASVVQGKKIRLRSVTNVLDEIELLVKHHGIKEIQFIDDNFSFYPEHILGVCRGIKERKLKFAWTLTNGIRADKVNIDILKEMKEAGCYYFAVGIESGSQRILKEVSKGLSLDRVESTTREADKLGFITQGFFMVGFPGETDADRQESSDFASKLKLDRMMAAPVMSLPGSEMFNTQYRGRLNQFDWSEANYKTWKPVPGAPEYSVTRKAIGKMRRRFYLNPIRMIRHISKVRTIHQAIGMVMGLKAVVKE